MDSQVFTSSRAPSQMTLACEPGLTERHESLLDCVAACVHRAGLTKVANALDWSRGNLSASLGPEPKRKCGVGDLEHFVASFGDLTPIYYLIERFLSDEQASRDDRERKALQLLEALPAILGDLGIGLGRSGKAASRGR